MTKRRLRANMLDSAGKQYAWASNENMRGVGRLRKEVLDRSSSSKQPYEDLESRNLSCCSVAIVKQFQYRSMYAQR